MEFFDVIKFRRSCRIYTSDPVPPEVIHRALDAALIAPTSSNMQPWEFYWVRTPDNKKRLSEACLSQSAARTAQELIVVVARRDTWRRNRRLMLDIVNKLNLPKSLRDYYGKLIPLMYEHGPFSIFAPLKWVAFNLIGLFRPMVRSPLSNGQTWQVILKTAALACENLMLAIVAQGYACCPMEGFDEPRVKRILGLRWNPGARVVMVISIGRADPKGIWGEQVRHDRGLFVFEK